VVKTNASSPISEEKKSAASFFAMSMKIHCRQPYKPRTSYKCKKCGQPKRGHVCPFRSTVVLPGEAKETRTVACQVEIDARFIARLLDLAAQGFPESYGEKVPAPVAPFEMPPLMDDDDDFFDDSSEGGSGDRCDIDSGDGDSGDGDSVSDI